MEGYVLFSWNCCFTEQENQEYQKTLASNQNNDVNNDSFFDDNEKEGNKNSINRSSSIKKLSLRNTMNSIINLSQNLLEYFVKEIFIGISLALLKSKDIEQSIGNKYMNKFITEVKDHLFDSSKRGHDDNDYFKYLNIESELETRQIYIRVYEHAPKIFKKLRDIEDLDIDIIVKSLINSNATNLSVNKGGASNALFLPTKNNQFLIKTMEDVDFLTLISHSFLTYYLHHLKTNPESLICRFYGIYTIFTDKEAKPLRLILMRNMKGPIQRYIRGSYDLKGSTMNRYVKVDPDKIGTYEQFKITK